MSRKAPKKPNQKGQDEDRENKLQAVVLADSFETRFSPFTLERPRCLLPLANTPLIEYTFECLANAGVEEVFIYCGAHTDQVKHYLSHSKWDISSSPFSKLKIFDAEFKDVGDIMRDLDHADLITGDFLVVTGDVVSNFPLDIALAKHRARRLADKNAIMTMVLREAGTEHRTKAKDASPVFVIDPTKDRCLHYEEMASMSSNKTVNIDPDLFSRHSELDIRQDLIDCYIDICTPDVLALWTDSFDYTTPRKQFLFGILKDYDLNGKTIHIHIVKDHYASRVRSLQAYDAVSKDIISRWAYPLCPDSNLLQGHSYQLQRGNIYKEENVVLARSCVVKPRTVIGQNTSIGDGSVVGNSILGRRCQIGKNVTVYGCYIWDDAVIGDGSDIRQTIVANEAVVGKNCRVEPGCLLSFAVRLADGLTLPKGTRLTRSKRREKKVDGAPSWEYTHTEDSIVGKGGEGTRFTEEAGEDEDDVDGGASSGLLYTLPNLSNASISTLNTDSADELIQPLSPGSVPTSVSGEDSETDFRHDAVPSLFDSFQRGDTADVIQLELMGLRLSSDASDHQVRHAIVAALMKWIQHVMENESIGAGDAVTRVLRKYKTLVQRTIFDQDMADKADQVDLLLLIQQDLVHRDKGESTLVFMAKELYFLELVEEEAYDQWWKDGRSQGDDGLMRVRSQTEQFIVWLANAEEDSESDSQNEEDSDEA
ncbi:MAG: hypothetical protein M1812_000952 [Candelaria pacifica]|nr:MAG: hypothetical protein M1812_000952 [Candelaria pacifica]